MSISPDDPTERAYRALLLETMRPCPELPRHEREAKRAADRWEQEALGRNARAALAPEARAS